MMVTPPTQRKSESGDRGRGLAVADTNGEGFKSGGSVGSWSEDGKMLELRTEGATSSRTRNRGRGIGGAMRSKAVRRVEGSWMDGLDGFLLRFSVCLHV